MKKILFASTALIAFGAVSAQAAEPIKLQLGGFSKWWVGYASQDERFEKRTATNTGNNYTSVDVQGDNEVFFKGSTTLDNGIKIGIDVQLEAGGNTETTGGDTIDESYVTIDGGFGRVILGSENNGAYLLHVSAPDAAANLDEGLITQGRWVVNPGITTLDTTAIVTDGDAEKITYVSPSFAGFTVGGTYVPDAGTEDSRTVTNNTGGGVNEAYGAGAAYNNTFGGVGVKASVGYVIADIDNGTYTEDTEWSAGAQVSYAGFTFGGSYRDQEFDAKTGFRDRDGEVWNAGLQYATGPFAVSLAYFQSTVDRNTAGRTDDKDVTRLWQVSGKYNMGPGVDLLASGGHITFDGTDYTANSYNSGWIATTGLSLAF